MAAATNILIYKSSQGTLPAAPKSKSGGRGVLFCVGWFVVDSPERFLITRALRSGPCAPGEERRSGGVAERSKAADCKSALFGVRRFESFPLHHSPGGRREPSERRRAGNECGCSSMVELQPSKLATWVRFPSPAPGE